MVVSKRSVTSGGTLPSSQAETPLLRHRTATSTVWTVWTDLRSAHNYPEIPYHPRFLLPLHGVD